MNRVQHIHWKALPADVQDRVNAVTRCKVALHRGAGDPRVPLLAHRARHSRVWVYGLVAAAGIALGIGAWIADLSAVDSPGYSEQGVVVFSLLAALTLVPLLLFVGYLVARRGSPFARGVFVTATDLIDTRDPVLRIVALDACQVVAIEHRVNFVVHGHCSMTVVVPGGRRVTFPLLSRQEVADVQAALASLSRDPAARAAADAFASMRIGDGRIDRPAAARPGIMRAVAPVVVGLVLAVPVGAFVAELRQRAHDAAAFAAAESRSERLEYAKWGRRGAEVREALGIHARKKAR